jgi:imidazolonepropionase-like amidohydrolase
VGLVFRSSKLNVINVLKILILATSLVGAAHAAEESRPLALPGANLVDLQGTNPVPNAVVLVSGEKIVAVGEGSSVSVPDTAQIIDLNGLWLIPGLMNMHVHLGLKLPGKMAAELADETEAERVLRMAAYAREILQAGVTTIRSPGNSWPPVSPGHEDIALRKAIRSGQADGPRIFSAGEALVITGGHGSASNRTYNDGPYQLVKGERREISSGADWVKIVISGGVATEGGGINGALMTPKRLQRS